MTDPTTLGAAAVEHLGWLRLRELSPKSIRQRELALRLLAGHLAPRGLLDATSRDLDAWQRAVAGTLAARSRASYVSNIAEFYRWAVREGRLPADPSAVLIRPKLTPLRPKPVSDRDATRAESSVPEEVRVWLVLAGKSGLRAGEIASLCRADVLDELDEPLLLLHGKGGKSRYVPLHPLALAGLREWGMPDSGPLFVDDGGAQLTGAQVSQRANHVLRKLRVPSLHKWRHRFATELYRQTGDLLLVRDILGHSSVAVSEIYAESVRAASAYKAVAAL